MTLRSLTHEELARLTGTLFNNRYRLTRVIGCGANGAVYEAEDLQFTGKPVAVKLALSVFSETEFNREARLLGQLNDEFVVKVLEYGVQDGIPFIVMDYLEGENLLDMLKRFQRKLPFELITKFVLEIGQALRSAHDKNVIHRDLKPQNVLHVNSGNLDDFGRPIQKFVLVDFGIASKFDAKSTINNATMAGLGTPEYRSPEQINAKDDSPSTDIYTFGVVLYELLAGRVPFPAQSGSQSDLGRLCIAIETQPPPPFREVAPDRDVDPAIEELVLQCLEKDSNQRPKTIREIRRRYLEIVDPASVLDTVQPSAATLQPGTIGPAGRGIDTAGRGRTDTRPWKTAAPSSRGRRYAFAGLAALIAVVIMGAKFWPKPVWQLPHFEPRGDLVTIGEHRYAKEMVRNVPGLPPDQEVVFVLVHSTNPTANGPSDFYILRDKVWYALYGKFVEAAEQHPDEVNLAELNLSLDDLKKPLAEREKSFPDESADRAERDRWPVTNVSLNAAYGFARWLASGRGELPCVEDWWAAAGWHPGVDATKGPFHGDGTKVASNRASPAVVGASEDDKGIDPSGCNDMAGNGYEWTANAHPAVEDVRNVGVAPKLTFPTHEKAVYVGGSFLDEPARFSDYKGTDTWPSWGGIRKDIGFRVVIHLP